MIDVGQAESNPSDPALQNGLLTNQQQEKSATMVSERPFLIASELYCLISHPTNVVLFTLTAKLPDHQLVASKMKDIRTRAYDVVMQVCNNDCQTDLRKYQDRPLLYEVSKGLSHSQLSHTGHFANLVGPFFFLNII